MDAWRTALVLLMLLAPAGRAEARPAQRLTLHYDIYYLAFRILSIDVASDVAQNGYRSTVALRTAGVLALLAPWESTATVNGTVEGGTLRPVVYHVRSEYRERHQQIDLVYASGGAVRGGVDGILSDGERDAVPTELRDGTVDPVTAGEAVAQRLADTGTCAGIVRIFDGLRRYDLRYEDLGMAELPPSGRDAFSGSARHCRATVDPIAGFLRTGDHAGERATELSVWLAAPVPGATPTTVRMDVVGTHGTLHVHLGRATTF